MGQDVVAAAAVVGNGIPEPIVPSAAAISLAPGFRFHPTDEELVRYYLTRKVCGKPFRFEAVSEIDLYKSEPWELACHASLKSRDLEWFFFCSLDKKYDNGSRMNRATVQGYWKATGKDRVVRHKSRTIGMKKTAVYHHGRAPDGKRTDWIMHEYRLCDSELEQAGVVQDAFVLCRIFQKSGLGPPNASRYAAFIEEEWNDDDTGGLFVPGGGGDQEAEDDDTINGDDGLTGGGNGLEMIPADDYLDVKKFQNKNSDEPCKRQRANNSSDKSTNTNQLNDLAITTIPSKRKYPIKLFGAILSESVKEEQPREEINHPPPTDHVDDDANKKKTVEYASKFISILENELGNVTMERERLKIEVMRAEAMINMLKSRVDLLAHENEDLRKKNMQSSLV